MTRTKRKKSVGVAAPARQGAPKLTWADVEEFDIGCDGSGGYWSTRHNSACKDPCKNPECRDELGLAESADPFTRLVCCGVVEFEGTSRIKSAVDAYAIRRAAFLFGSSGLVIATPTHAKEITRTAPYFRKAGWRKGPKFTNPRTGNLIQVWLATTLKKGEKGD